MNSKYCARGEEPDNNQPDVTPPVGSNPTTRFALQQFLTKGTGAPIVGDGIMAASFYDSMDRMGLKYPTIQIGPFA